MAKPPKAAPTKPLKPAPAPVDDVEFDELPEPERREIAHSIFVEVATGGRRPGQELIALHEIPLLERKLRALKSEIAAINLSVVQLPGRKTESKPKAHRRGHTMEEIEEMYGRLTEKYTFLPEGAREGDEVELMASIYGVGREGLKALGVTMRKLDKAFDAFMDAMGDRAPEKKDFLKFINENGPKAAIENEIEAEIASFN